MPKVIMFVQSSPSSREREDEFNDWYTNGHLAAVLKIPGVTAARRFRATNIGPGATPRQAGAHRYCVIL